MAFPNLTFYSELEASPLEALFTKRVIDDLRALNASLALGILDLSETRAGVVKRLNQAGVPVIAWLLLPKEQGYWFNLENATQAAARYAEFRAWSDEQGLLWDGVGLDIEPDINELAMFFNDRRQLAGRVARRLFSWRRFGARRGEYADLVGRIQADGYRVDSYQFPLIADERKARSTLLQRAAGLVDIPADREVWMLYSSLVRPYGPAMIASYALEAEAIGLGSTGGGVEQPGLPGPAALSWEELSRDLRLAWYWCTDLHIFSLEGCVQQGYLERLRSFTWDLPLIMPEAGMARVRNLRQALTSSLWLGSHFLLILLGLVSALLLARGVHGYLRKRKD
jgi:hypothetical protein